MKELIKEIPKDILDGINNNSDDMEWHYIGKEYVLTEDFIRENSDKLDWFQIGAYQKLSEKFIIENEDKLDWDLIVINQDLSEEFIIENKDRIAFSELIYNKKLNTFSKEIQDLILASVIDCGEVVNFTNKENWYYKYMTDYMKKQYERLNMFL